MREYNGYSLFDDAEEPLKSYNRMKTALNIYAYHGITKSEEYLNMIEVGERQATLKVYEDIQEMGIKEVGRLINNGEYNG